jgi:hypothetical protein
MGITKNFNFKNLLHPKYILLSVFMVWVLFGLLRNNTDDNKEIKLLDFASRIKSLDLKRGGVYMITLANGQYYELMFYPNTSLKTGHVGFYDNTNKGDSITKKSGSDTVFIIRDSIVYLWRIYYP